MKKYVKIHIMLFKNWKLLLKIIFYCMPNNTVFWNGFWGTNQLPPINYVQGASNSISILERTENPQNEKLSRYTSGTTKRKSVNIIEDIANSMSVAVTCLSALMKAENNLLGFSNSF